jgi:hypothetical protein
MYRPALKRNLLHSPSRDVHKLEHKTVHQVVHTLLENLIPITLMCQYRGSWIPKQSLMITEMMTMSSGFHVALAVLSSGIDSVIAPLTIETSILHANLEALTVIVRIIFSSQQALGANSWHFKRLLDYLSLIQLHLPHQSTQLSFPALLRTSLTLLLGGRCARRRRTDVRYMADTTTATRVRLLSRSRRRLPSAC